MGFSAKNLLSRGRLLCSRLGNEPVQRIANELQLDCDAPDLLQAMCRLLDRAGDVGGKESFEAVREGYELATLVTWEEQIGERSELLAQLALIAWRHCRRFRTYRETRSWEERCVRETMSQDHVRDFLSLPAAARSDSLSRRFFSDSAVVLAFTRQLEAKRNADLGWVASEAVNLFETLDRLQLPACEEERGFFMASVAVSAAAASRHLGMLRASDHWLAQARRSLHRVMNPKPYAAIIDFAELSLCNDRHDPRSVLERVGQVRKELFDCGIDWHAKAAGLLLAGALKDAGRLPEAASVYRQVVESTSASNEPLLLGLALMSVAEVEARLNADFELDSFREAQAVLETQEVRWPIANLQASIGECLRDRGRLNEAIEAYRTSIHSFQVLGMKTRVAYIKLVLAETLIASGQDAEAVREIAHALKVAEAEGIAADFAAGVTLLQEALRRASASSGNVIADRLIQIRKLAKEGCT